MKRIIWTFKMLQAKYYTKALEKVTRKLEETEPGDLVMNNFYLRLFMMYSEKSLKYTNALLA